MDSVRSTARREFLKFLLASPYVAALGGAAAFLEQRVLAQSGAELPGVIAAPAESPPSASRYGLMPSASPSRCSHRMTAIVSSMARGNLASGDRE